MQEIHRTLVRQWIEYTVLWVVAALIVLLFEWGCMEEGALAGEPRVTFTLQTAEILLTLALVPLSLKLYAKKLVGLSALPLLQALKAYHRWGMVRLCLLTVVVWGNLVIYYLTLNNIGSLCALIGVAASLFCVPGRRRLLTELKIES